MKTFTKFISLICLLVWSCSAFSQGEIWEYQRGILAQHVDGRSHIIETTLIGWLTENMELTVTISRKPRTGFIRKIWRRHGGSGVSGERKLKGRCTSCGHIKFWVEGPSEARDEVENGQWVKPINMRDRLLSEGSGEGEWDGLITDFVKIGRFWFEAMLVYWNAGSYKVWRAVRDTDVGIVRSESEWESLAGTKLHYDGIWELSLPDLNGVIQNSRGGSRTFNFSGIRTKYWLEGYVEGEQGWWPKWVNFANCGLTDEEARRLMNKLKRQTSLVEINITGNNLSAKFEKKFWRNMGVILSINGYDMVMENLRAGQKADEGIVRGIMMGHNTDEGLLGLVATNAHTSGELLHTIAGHPKVNARLIYAVVQHPATNAEGLRSVLMNTTLTDAGILAAVANHKNVDADLLLSVAQHPMADLNTLLAVVKNVTTDARGLMAVIQNQRVNDELIFAVISHRNVTGDIIREVISRFNLDARMINAIVGNHMVGSEALLILARNIVNPADLSPIIMHPNVTGEVLAEIAANANADGQLLEYIATHADVDDNILCRVAENRNTNEAGLNVVANSEKISSQVLDIVSEHPNVTPRLLGSISARRELLREVKVNELLTKACDMNTNADDLLRIINDPEVSAAVLAMVIEHDNVNSEHLLSIASRPTTDITGLRAVYNHPQVTNYCLSVLECHPYADDELRCDIARRYRAENADRLLAVAQNRTDAEGISSSSFSNLNSASQDRKADDLLAKANDADAHIGDFLKIVTHPNAPTAALAAIVSRAHTSGMLIKIAGHHNVDAATLLTIARNPMSSVVLLNVIIHNPNVNADVLAAVAVHRNVSYAIMLAILKSFATNVETLRLIVNSPKATVPMLKLAAMHPNIDSDLLEVVASHPGATSDVLLAVANNRVTNLSGLQAVVYNPNFDLEVLSAVASHSNVNEELLAEIERVLEQPHFDGNIFHNIGESYANTTISDEDARVDQWPSGSSGTSGFFVPRMYFSNP